MTANSMKARRREHQRREILGASRELLLRDGYENFSMRKLAQAFGCVPGTLYLYFKDKHDLIAQLVDESFERLTEIIEAPADDHNELQALRRIMRAYVDFGLANPNLYHFAFMLRRTEQLEKARPRPHRSFNVLRQYVRACIDQGFLTPIDLELATQGIWTSLHGVTALMITIPNFPWADRNQLIDHVLSAAIAALRANEPSGKEGV